jgi:hypothetical protein
MTNKYVFKCSTDNTFNGKKSRNEAEDKDGFEKTMTIIQTGALVFFVIMGFIIARKFKK